MTAPGVWALAIAGLLFWTGLALDRRRAWPHRLRLPTEPDPPDPRTTVTVVVPARDEREVLPATLPTLLQQSWPGLSVILVDDQSSDGTATMAQDLAATAAAHPADRFQVLAVTERDPAWTGKVFALARGVERATEARPDLEWLLFSDADIGHRPGSIAALLEVARRGPYDLVSVMARLHAQSFWERLLIPPFVYFFQLLYPFSQVRRAGSKVAAAAGGCVLVRRSALARAGGLAAIQGAVIDDVSLAKAVKEAGGRLWLGLDDGIVSVRPYRGLGQLWHMVSRSAFVQLRKSFVLLGLVLLGLAVFVVSPPVLVALKLLGMTRPGGATAGAGAVLAIALTTWLLETLALLPSVRHHRVPLRYAPTLPVAGALYGLMTASSAIDHLRGRGSRWKGRSYIVRSR